MISGNSDLDETMSSPAWLRATYGIRSVPEESWRRLLSRHLKLAEMVGVQGGHTTNGNHQGQQQDVTTQGVHPAPLHAAAGQGMLRAGARLLAIAPGDVDMRDPEGRTAMHWAAMTNHVEFIQMLLESGGNVDARDSCRRTPLLVCCAFGSSDAARLLLEWGAQPNAEDKMGLTPLHACAGAGDLDTAEVLLAAGADTRRRSVVGAFPRNIAERQGHEDMVELLTSSGRHDRTSNNSNGSIDFDESGGFVDEWSRFDMRSMVPQRAPMRQ